MSDVIVAKESHLRSVLKAFSWRIVATLVPATEFDGPFEPEPLPAGDVSWFHPAGLVPNGVENALSVAEPAGLGGTQRGCFVAA